MKQIGKIILKVIEFVIILYVVLISTVLLCRNKYGYTQFGDRTIVTMGQKDTRYLKEFGNPNTSTIKMLVPLTIEFPTNEFIIIKQKIDKSL